MAKSKQRDEDRPLAEDEAAAATEAEAGNGGDAEPGAAEPEVDDRLAELQAEVGNLKDQLLRALAETENVRRRLEQQAEDRGKFAVSGFARDMLTVADNLRRALQAVPAEMRDNETARNFVVGVEMTERELQNILERHGIKAIEAMGQPFDPHLHQAMMEVEDSAQPSGTVVQEMQTGYVIHDRLLRPAMVGVSKGGPKREAQGGENGDKGEGVDTTA